MCVQNGYHGAKLFIFDGTESIVKEEFKDVEEYRKRYMKDNDVHLWFLSYIYQCTISNFWIFLDLLPKKKGNFWIFKDVC